jgi:hypothetical protein
MIEHLMSSSLSRDHKGCATGFIRFHVRGLRSHQLLISRQLIARAAMCATGAVHTNIFRSIKYLPNPFPSRKKMAVAYGSRAPQRKFARGLAANSRIQAQSLAEGIRIKLCHSERAPSPEESALPVWRGRPRPHPFTWTDGGEPFDPPLRRRLTCRVFSPNFSNQHNRPLVRGPRCETLFMASRI